MSTGDLYTRLQAAFLLLDDGDRRLLARHGLTPTQLATLNALDPFEGHRLIDIAGRLLVDKSTVTRLIDRLEQQGLAQRVADPTDRRAQRVRLTASGVARRAQAQAAHDQSIALRLGALRHTDIAYIGSLLGTLNASLQEQLGHDTP